jgi:hypothetical protein
MILGNVMHALLVPLRPLAFAKHRSPAQTAGVRRIQGRNAEHGPSFEERLGQ